MGVPHWLALLGLVKLGCAAAPSAREEPTPSVTGTLVTVDGVGIPVGSRVQLTLADVSRADAPAVVLARTELTEVEPQPLRFVLPYHPADIQPSHTYVVSARVTDSGGQLRFLNVQAFNVLTRGAPSHVDLVVNPVQRP